MSYVYDDLINLALDIKDYNWARKLVFEKDNSDSENFIHTEPVHESIALTDIFYIYAAKETGGLREIIYASESDIMNAVLVRLSENQIDSKNKYLVKKDQLVEYVDISLEEAEIVKHYLLGY